MNIKEHLTKARELLSDPAKWTRGAMAKDACGKLADVTGPNATCFCLQGALCRVAPIGHSATHVYLAQRLAKRNKGYDGDLNDIAAFNDHYAMGHADVLAVLDEAIAQCPTP